MAEYIPSTADWVRDQVELYESSGGTQGATLRKTGLPCIIMTNRGNKTGGIRKTPLMRVKDGDNYVLVGSRGGAPTNPQWVYNLRAHQDVEVRDATEVHSMRVREIEQGARVPGAHQPRHPRISRRAGVAGHKCPLSLDGRGLG